MTATGNALIYCRVSGKGQQQDGTSLESQEEECRKHVAKLGLTVGRVTREVHTGAELWDRPLLSRDREDLVAGRFHALIVYESDRLSRDPTHLAIVAEDCVRGGAALEFVIEPLEDSDEGKLLRYIKGFVSKKEREKIRERTLRGKHTRVRLGKVHNMGPELYGYRRDREHSVRLIYDPEAVIVRRIYMELAIERRSYHAIARRLNADGVPVPSAARVAAEGRTDRIYWTANTIYRIVRNPAYKGEEYVWRWRQVKKGSGYIQTRRPAEEHVKLPETTTPAIVTADLWAQAQSAVAKQSGDRTRNEQTPYLLRGLIYCGQCGRKMWASWYRLGTDKSRPKVRSYRCSSNNAPEGLCGGRIANAEKIEAWVWEQVVTEIQTPGKIEEALERRRSQPKASALPSDLEKAKTHIAECESQQKRLLQKFTSARDESFPWQLVEDEIRRLESEKRRWETTRDDIEERITEEQKQDREDVEELEALRAYRECPPHDLAAFTWEHKRKALEALRVRVSADGQDWHIAGQRLIGPKGDVLLQTC